MDGLTLKIAVTPPGDGKSKIVEIIVGRFHPNLYKLNESMLPKALAQDFSGESERVICAAALKIIPTRSFLYLINIAEIK